MDVAATVTLDEKRVWQRMGHRDPARVNAHVRRAFATVFPQAQALLRPRVAYRLLTLTEVDREAHVLHTPEARFCCPDLIRMFGACHGLAGFVATVGAELEAEVQRRAAADDVIGGFMLDVVASEALAVLIRNLRARIQRDPAVRGEVTRYWYCPGYGNWDVAEQKPLFAALHREAQAVGVRLNAYCAMSPRKSYSGLFGVGAPRGADPWNSDIPWVAR